MGILPGCNINKAGALGGFHVLTAYNAFGLLCALLLASGNLPGLAGEAKLKGEVEQADVLPSTATTPGPVEPMPVPVLRSKAGGQKAGRYPDELKGQDDTDRPGTLGGRAEALGGAENGKPDSKTGMLHGTATKQGASLEGDVEGVSDPDAADQELMIEWDRWRNRFLHAIQSGMQESLNNPEQGLRWDPARQAMVNRFPLGTTAWFSCQVTPDRRISHIKLLHSSGYPAYDRAVLDAIDALQGSSILRYPTGSRRQVVVQTAGIKTAEQAEYRNFHFGDVERQRVPY